MSRNIRDSEGREWRPVPGSSDWIHGNTQLTLEVLTSSRGPLFMRSRRGKWAPFNQPDDERPPVRCTHKGLSGCGCPRSDEPDMAHRSEAYALWLCGGTVDIDLPPTADTPH